MVFSRSLVWDVGLTRDGGCYWSREYISWDDIQHPTSRNRNQPGVRYGEGEGVAGCCVGGDVVVGGESGVVLLKDR